jgi:hypothetical protein
LSSIRVLSAFGLRGWRGVSAAHRNAQTALYKKTVIDASAVLKYCKKINEKECSDLGTRLAVLSETK